MAGLRIGRKGPNSRRIGHRCASDWSCIYGRRRLRRLVNPAIFAVLALMVITVGLAGYGTGSSDAEAVNRAVAATLTALAPVSELEPIERATLTPAPEPTDTPEPTQTTPKATQTPVATSTATFTPASIASATPAPKVNANANLRAGPGTDYDLRSRAVAGQVIDIVSQDATGEWFQLATGHWILAKLVDNPPVKVSVAATIPARPTPTYTPSPTPTSIPIRAITPVPTPYSAPSVRTCCKICSKGKACGDSCIARNETCHKGVGCACNAP
jgi:hypothetical protein